MPCQPVPGGAPGFLRGPVGEPGSRGGTAAGLGRGDCAADGPGRSLVEPERAPSPAPNPLVRLSAPPGCSRMPRSSRDATQCNKRGMAGCPRNANRTFLLGRIGHFYLALTQRKLLAVPRLPCPGLLAVSLDLASESSLERAFDAHHATDAAHAFHPKDEVAGVHLDNNNRAALVGSSAFADWGAFRIDFCRTSLGFPPSTGGRNLQRSG